MIPICQFEQLSPEDILNRDMQAEEDVGAAVDAVLAEVRKNGDAALRAYTKQFDGAELKALQVTERELEDAVAATDADFLETLRQAAENIRTFHEQQVHRDFDADEGRRHCHGPAVYPD